MTGWRASTLYTPAPVCRMPSSPSRASDKRIAGAPIIDVIGVTYRVHAGDRERFGRL